jgi:hypothetical protein
MYIQRDAEESLIRWKNSSIRKPLILKGARQVGKTFLLKWLGTHQFTDYAYFNFDEKPELKQFFEETKDVTRIINNLSIIHRKQINENTLIIFDEVQECIPALNSLKYFSETLPEQAIACAGSLLGITLGKEASFPVGKVTFAEIYPISFMEFLRAAEATLFDYLMNHPLNENIPDIFFNPIRDYLKKYFITGGLPEAVLALLEHKDLEFVLTALKDIITTYKFDFSKHPVMKDVAKIAHIWDSIPSQLGRENKKFIYQLIKKGARAREYEDAIKWLEQAGLVCKIHRCNEPRLPLIAYDDLHSFKLYLFDVGVLRQLSNLDPGAFVDKNRLFTEFKGALTENYILQSLRRQLDVIPRYWTSQNEAEVDFIIQYKNKIIPAEVKSDENVRSKSLAFYNERFNPDIRIRYSMKNLTYDDNLINIPLFMADMTNIILDKYFENQIN